MKIRFQCSGGFAGVVTACELDSDQLPEDEAQKLETLLGSVKFENDLKQRSLKSRDHFSYHITLDGDRGETIAEFDDTNIPENARPLIEFLRSKSVARAPK